MHKDLLLRLAKYQRMLIHLCSLNMDNIHSGSLGEAVGVTPSLIRKDLSQIGFHGNRRGGYSATKLRDYLKDILGITSRHETILVGCGHFGRIVLENPGLFQQGTLVTAGFDIDPSASEIAGIPISPMETLPSFLKKHSIVVALMTVPASAAVTTRNLLIQLGIRGIINFAPIELKQEEHCIIFNVNIGFEVEKPVSSELTIR